MRQQIELLNWVLKLLASGMPYGMIAGIVRKKVLELEKLAKCDLPSDQPDDSPHIF